ncbi:ABC transporter substrate-binding protein [Acuticoccus sp.]|uniref:ABC transporter substrate-binding protein n=1 Tax=Acuticoccus sp. TaxID=1904378 RepID=UPI003B528CA8
MRTHMMRAAVLAVSTTCLAGPALAETVLRVVPQADLKITDPVWTTAAITQNHGYMVYDMLFAMDSELNPQPQMVESWEVSEDDLTWTFTLREGLLFHDGSPVEASDVVASIQRWAARRADGQALLPRVEAMNALDARTFEIVLSKPFGPMLQVLANPTAPLPVMREEEASTDPNEQVTEMIGSGPFVFDDEAWVPGDRVVYRKFEDYVPRDEPVDGFAGGKVVNIDTVEWIYIPDTNTATQALQSGQVDVYEIPPMDLVPVLQADPNITVKVLDPLGKMGHIRPNHLYPPFDDPRARQALQLLVDQREFLAAQVGNPDFETVCYSVFMCDSPFENENHAQDWREPNKERAKELLTEAGYNFEDPLVVMLPTDQQIIYNNMLVMVGKLEEIGVNVDAQAMDWSTLTSRRARDDDPRESPNVGWHLFPTWWTGVPMSSPLTNSPLVATGDPVSAWFGWPEDEETERLRAAFMDATTEEEQREVIDDLQKRFYEFMPYINTGQFVTPVAWRNEVTGVPNALLFVPWGLEKEG